ncbi:hypothetical protein Pan181_43700 [Aeoliella mucimassa]|uniref:Uncharacterized protein n=1 Tax=Aeoliella mucimassa TaxID=2527972 RepID=A0A518ATT7_9BACT|nr:hypothetical protein Pan181_43700 [Aeoliella mucimassa]
MPHIAGFLIMVDLLLTGRNVVGSGYAVCALDASRGFRGELPPAGWSQNYIFVRPPASGPQAVSH